MDYNNFLQALIQRMQSRGQMGPSSGGGLAQAMAPPQNNYTPGQEFWGRGGQGDPNKRVPMQAPQGGNNWSLANQGYFAPMGGPDYRYGVGEGGKPAAAGQTGGGGGGMFGGGGGSIWANMQPQMRAMGGMTSFGGGPAPAGTPPPAMGVIPGQDFSGGGAPPVPKTGG